MANSSPLHPMPEKAHCLPCVITLFFLLALSTFSGELPSGMHYVVTETSFSPLQSIYAIVQVGSAYETQETSGLSHLLEHLLFDGTQKLTRAQLKQEFDDRGIYVNAFTREDYTAFLITATPEDIPQALDLLFQMLLNSTLPQEEFFKEQKVVIEEMRKDRMNPVQVLEEKFLLSLPPSSPYRLPVIGSEETIRSISREKVWDFYRKHYIPENITLLSYGPLKQEEFLRIISEISPQQSRKEFASPSFTHIPPPEKMVIKEKDGAVHYYLLFPSPLRSMKHLVAYEWFIQWATRRWKAEDFSAQEISFELFPFRYQPFLRIHLQFSQEETAEKVIPEIRSRILGTLLDKEAEQIASGLLKKLYADKVFMSENVTYMGMWLADWLGRGLFVPLERYLDTIQHISFSEIRHILISEWGNKHQPPQEDVSEEILPPGVVQRTLSNGLRIIAHQRQGSPVFAVNTLILHPLYHEPEGFSGLHTLLQMLLGKETDEYPPDEIEKITQEGALRIKTTDDPALPFDDYYFSPFFSYVRIETLKDSWQDSLRFLVSVLRHSRFSENIVVKNREMLQSLLQKYGNKPDEQLRDAATRHFFPSHPYGKNWRGIFTEVEKIKQEDIEAYYRKTFQPQNIIISLVGDVDPEEMIGILEDQLKDWRAEYFVKLPGWASQKGRHSLSVEGKMAGVTLFCPVAGAQSPEFSAIQVAALILSEQLNERLREEKGFVYTISSSVLPHPDFGIWRTSYVTGRENLEASLEELASLIEQMKQNLPPSEVIRRSLARWKAQYLRYSQSSINLAYFLGAYAFWKNEPEEALKPWEKLEQTTPHQIQEMMQKYLELDRCVLVTAQPSSGYQ